MKTRSIRLLALAASVTALTPGLAAAATPGAVAIRVEGTSATTVPATRVDTTATPLAVTDGVDSATCPGTSALAALNTATGGSWSGDVHPSFGPSVETVKGETHTFASGRYWAFWVNGQPADAGACGVELNPGDSVVFFVGCAGATSDCADGTLLTTVPATAKPGDALSVAVQQASVTYSPPTYDPVFTTVGAGGASVAFGTATTTAAANGNASFTVPDARGSQTIVISKPGFARFTAPICVSNGADGECGSVKPIPGTTTATAQTVPEALAAGCIHVGNDGRCGTTDATPPLVQLRDITEDRKYSRKSAPRDLKGVVGNFSGGVRTDDPSGLKDVRLRIVRTVGNVCRSYDGEQERFERMAKCGLGKGQFFSVGKDATWSYLLPKRLAAGAYTIEAHAIDGKGNVLRTRKPDLNFFSFRVR